MNDPQDLTAKTATHMPLWRKALFALVPLVALLAAAEVGFRLFGPKPSDDPALHWRRLQRYHPFLGIARRPSGSKILDDQYGRRSFTTNNLGFRGEDVVQPKPPGTFRIVCLGGSTTENEFVDDADTYPAILQRLLRARVRKPKVEVVNAGCATYSTAHTFINYALRVSSLQPDLVTIYHAINDLVPGACPGFRPDYAHFYRFSHLVDAMQTDLKLEVRTPLDSVLGWSAVFRFAKTRVERRLGHNLPEPANFKTQPATRVAEAAPAIFERNLRATIRLAKSDGARVLLCTFPNSLRENMTSAERARIGGFGWSKFLTVAGIRDGLCRYNAIIARLAREEGVLLADLERVVPKDADHFFDACHMTPRGQRLAAAELCRVLTQAKVIAQPRSRPPTPPRP